MLPVSKFFSSCKTKTPYTLLNNNSPFPTPHQVPGNHNSVSISLTTLETSYQRNHICVFVTGLFHLA